MSIENEFTVHTNLSTEELFNLYSSLHFIYPEKLERLQPVFNLVRNNWERAMKMNFPLFWVSTIIEKSSNIVSTSTTWQYLNKGMIGQHLASNNPVGTRIVFLGTLKEIIETQDKGFSESYQLYYRPQNKYSSRMYESLILKLGSKLSEIRSYKYLEVPLLKQCPSQNMSVRQIYNGADPGFTNFMLNERGALFPQAQELDGDDLSLKKLNKKFQLYGLTRKRKIFAATSPHDNKIYGVIIVNQSSLGFNFSFFENSSELILCKDADAGFLFRVAESLLLKASEVCAMSPLRYLPVLVDPAHADVVERLHGKVANDYNLFIVLRGGFETWYEHVDQLTRNVFTRFINNSYAAHEQY